MRAPLQDPTDNPYMRDALMAEMQPGATKTKGPLPPSPPPPGVSTAYGARGGAMTGNDTTTPTSSGRGLSSAFVDPGTSPGIDQGVDLTPPGQGVTPPPPPSPWDVPTSSKYAPRIVTENGQSSLTEHGNTRPLQPGQEVTDATKYRDDFWAANPTGFQAGVGPQRNEDYAPPAAAGTGGTGTGTGSGTQRYGGFDTQRAQDPSTSAKDAFYAASQQSGSMPSTKEDAEAWFNQYIKQAMIDKGYQVDWVKGDKAFVRTRENPGGEEIDFLQDAGGSDPRLAWQSNMDAGAGPSGGGTTAGSPGGNTGLNPLLSNPGVMGDINAQLDALIKGGMSMEKILQLMKTPGATTGASA